MKIVNIKRNKKQFEICFKEEKSLLINESIKDEYNLYVGKDLDSSLINKIKKDNEISNYFSLALKRLSTKDYSPSKIKEYLLKKGAKTKEIDIVIKKLKKYSLLNEDEIVDNVISFCDAKHYGYNKIIQMLNQREISKKKILSVKYNLKREKEEAKLLKDILLRKYKNKNTSNLKRSVFSALIRYGYNEEIASFYSSNVFNSAKVELNMLKLEYVKLFSSYSRKLKGKELNQKLIDKLMSKGFTYQYIKKVMEENNHEVY